MTHPTFPAILTAALGAALLASCATTVREGSYAYTGAEAKAPIMQLVEDISWRDGPASLPRGVRMAVPEGSPAQPGIFCLQLKLPADYRIPPHFHPKDERITVLRGTLHVGLGDTFEPARAKPLGPGSFAVIPPGRPHYAFTRGEEVVIQLNSVGPWEITYVNEADDPRRR